MALGAAGCDFILEAHHLSSFVKGIGEPTAGDFLAADFRG